MRYHTGSHEPSTEHTLLSPASRLTYAKSIHIGYVPRPENTGEGKQQLTISELVLLSQLASRNISYNTTGEEDFNDFNIVTAR